MFYGEGELRKLAPDCEMLTEEKRGKFIMLDKTNFISRKYLMFSHKQYRWDVVICRRDEDVIQRVWVTISYCLHVAESVVWTSIAPRASVKTKSPWLRGLCFLCCVKSGFRVQKGKYVCSLIIIVSLKLFRNWKGCTNLTNEHLIGW